MMGKKKGGRKSQKEEAVTREVQRQGKDVMTNEDQNAPLRGKERNNLA